jgi:hypothetical protein
VSWVQNVVRQFGLYLLQRKEKCPDSILVRKGRKEQTSDVSAIVAGIEAIGMQNGYVCDGELLKASEVGNQPEETSQRVV